MADNITITITKEQKELLEKILRDTCYVEKFNPSAEELHEVGNLLDMIKAL